MLLQMSEPDSTAAVLVDDDDLELEKIKTSVRKLCRESVLSDGMSDQQKRLQAPNSIENLVALWAKFADLCSDESQLIDICEEELEKIPDDKRCPMVRMYVQSKLNQFVSFSDGIIPIQEDELEKYELFPDEDKSVKRRKIGTAIEALDEVRGKVGNNAYCALANGVFAARRAIE